MADFAIRKGLEAMEEYAKALKRGQKEVRDCQARGRSVNPEVLHQVVCR